ncbi:serine/threonine-protein kinase [Nocardioides acrostichi]|uniref:Sulfotransferase family protein n=1 Tax=Nocardioides acrostichi TaxID=2784339 RepID=A0A930V4Q1_9ACTN|nr:hypothetical protein [Nocardioides acrostichi]MBF4163710.1 hypothetical protein [Nocardioides acrostichi]
MSERVLLHVGTPKTGTSQLQEVLFRNREALAEHGISYPAERFDAHFLAALDLMALPWGGLETEAIGCWDALAQQVREHRGTAIISHEILATASRSQVGRALESLGHGSGAEVHVVVSARDLVRQIPAEWQENVKHRSTISFERFLAQLRDPAREARIASWFWGVQELPDVLDRWAHELPPEHVHVVTVPPPGGDAGELWRRFEHTFGLTGLELDLDVAKANPSLGVPETALLRRLNQQVNPVLAPPDYRPLVRELLAHQTLSARSRSPRLALPPDVHPWAVELSASWIAELRRRGYDVVGDLDDLLGPPAPEHWADPDAPRESQVSGAALDALCAVLLDNARLRGEETRLAAELHEARERIAHHERRPLRESILTFVRRSAAGRGLHRVYRVLRGRSTRSA